MDATLRPRHFSSELFSYAENKKIFEIFQNILESFSVDRPNRPLEYLYDLLTKRGVYNVPRVYVLGPPSADRTLVCTCLALKLGLMHITQQSLIKSEHMKEIPSPSDWAELIKNRISMPDCVRNGWILEAFPRTRTEAFFLRKKGIFPTHIALIESSDMTDVNIDDGTFEIHNYLAQKPLILDLLRSSYVKTFFIDSDIDVSVNKVIDFVRSSQLPPMPYLPRMLLLGPYGSGRRTAAKRLVEKYHLVEINYQEELRRAAMNESSIKEQVYEILKTSSTVPDDLLTQIAANRLKKKDCIQSGWVMYNFPETVQQAELLTQALEGTQVNRAVFLDASLETCLYRVEPRRLDPMTGESYHLGMTPSVERKIKDRLIQLPGDSENLVKAEHSLYSDNVEELKQFFRNNLSHDIAVEVNADESEDKVLESVQGAILKSSKMKLLS